MAERESAALRRTIPLPLLMLYALGTTIGAGIFVVIGEIVGAAGVWAPLSFAIAALVAGLTGASFAELSARQPTSGGPVAWVEEAFGRRGATIAIGWAIVATGVVSAATIATGFVRYAGEFVGWPGWAILSALVVLPTTVAAIGIRPSAWFMAGMTLAGLVGLAIVLARTGANIAAWPAMFAGRPLLQMAAIEGALIGAFLAFYAFIGFEDLAHLGDEAKDAERAVPLAIFVTLGVSLALYVAVAMAALGTLPAERIAESRAPLLDLVRGVGWQVTAVAVLSLVTIGDGMLAQLIMVTRATHDLGERRRGAPRWLSRVWRSTGTPVAATLLYGGAILALALFFPTRTLATATSTIILLIFAVANVALIRIKRRPGGGAEGFRVPMVVPWLGAFSCLALIAAQVLVGGNG